MQTTGTTIQAPADVVNFVRERGGRLYVWTNRHRCCGGGFVLLDCSTEPPNGDRRFRPIAGEGIVVYLDPGPRNPPSELHLKLKGWPRRHVEAYWEGCVFVT